MTISLKHVNLDIKAGEYIALGGVVGRRENNPVLLDPALL